MVNKTRRGILAGLALAPVAPYVFGATGNPIPAENANAGYGTWRVQHWPTSFDWSTATVGSQTYTEVEGYLSDQSVNIGESIKLYVNCQEASYTVQVFRLGWYGGAGSRLMYTSPVMTGVKQPMPTVSALGTYDCNWATSLTIPIPANWTSGIYLVKMIAGTSKGEYLASFVVRDDDRVADFILASTKNTSQAYNNWGGKSLYEFNSLNGAKAIAVSFNRPETDDGGSGQVVHWELSMIRFMEREGYDIKYVSNIDVHRTPGILNKAKAYLSVGHDEYWSYEMRQSLITAQNAGIHTAFLSSNTCYWQVRFGADPRGVANRIMTSYKEQALTQDPMRTTNPKLTTCNFHDLPSLVTDPVAQPENALMGVMYHGDPVNTALVVSDATHWMFTGTGVVAGQSFAGLLGYETDALSANGFQPAGVRTPFASPDPFGTSHVAAFVKPSGAFVMGAGTMEWSWGVDFCPSWAPNSGADRSNAVFQAINRNILNRMIGAALVQPVVTISNNNGVLLNWAAITGATSYDVYRGTAAGVSTTGTPYKTGLASPTSIDTAVTTGTKYYYAVVARAGTLVESLASAEVNIVAQAGTTPVLTPQTIAFGAIAGHAVGDAPFPAGATASSGLAVTYTSSNTAVATVTAAGVITIKAVGSTNITASQGGDATYSPATPVVQPLTVTAKAKTAQTITFGALPTKTVGDGTFAAGGSASSGLAVTYTSSNTAVATVTNAGVITIKAAGTTNITANQAGNATYAAAAAVVQPLTVNAASASSVLAPTGLTGYSCGTSCWAYGAQGNKGGNRINWKQSATAGVTQNNIYRGTVAGQLTLIATIPAAIVYIDYSAVVGTTYHYQVSALVGATESPKGNDTAFQYTGL